MEMEMVKGWGMEKVKDWGRVMVKDWAKGLEMEILMD